MGQAIESSLKNIAQFIRKVLKMAKATDQAIDDKETEKIIVIVDDNESVLNSMRRELTLAVRKYILPFRLVSFQSSQEALKYISGNKIDLLITDIKMPYISGDMLVTAVKKYLPDLPIIVITGYATKESIAAVLAAEKNAFIFAKPWESKRLLQKIVDCLHVDREYGLID